MSSISVLFLLLQCAGEAVSIDDLIRAHVFYRVSLSRCPHTTRKELMRPTSRRAWCASPSNCGILHKQVPLRLLVMLASPWLAPSTASKRMSANHAPTAWFRGAGS